MSYVYQKKQAADLYNDLVAMGRNNFSYEGARALMDSLLDIADQTGEAIEYDPIAFCCEFTEYQADEIGQAASDFGAPEAAEPLAWLEENKQVIKFASGIIVQNI